MIKRPIGSRLQLQITSGVIILLLIVSSGSILASQNKQANVLLSEASQLMSDGKYSESEIKLKKATTLWSTHRTKSRIADAQKRQKKWASYKLLLLQANKMIESGRYREALSLLIKIDKSFPDYNKVQTAAAKAKNSLASALPDPTPVMVPAQKTPIPPQPKQPTRITSDRIDDSPLNQIHVMYVLPSDGEDRSYDINGQIATSVGVFQAWLSNQTGGRNFRLDTYKGSIDITFYRLSRSDAQLKPYGSYLRDQIELELKTAGYNKSNKLYAVYYDGGSTYSCGGGAWPPALPGTLAAIYLKGAFSGINCDNNTFSSNFDYRSASMIHELIHTMGFVATCAPNHTLNGHVSDDPRDLMYAGNQPWQPSILDIGRNDYYGHSKPNCANLADSPYFNFN